VPDGQGVKMGTNLFVGNLPYSMSEQDLIDLFAQVGQVVSAQVIFDRTTHRSRGFGFVQMNDETCAAAAIERFHQQEVMGRPLTVNEAKPREEGSSQGGGWGRP
jgi:cold-inducible RNA-binding protein